MFENYVHAANRILCDVDIMRYGSHLCYRIRVATNLVKLWISLQVKNYVGIERFCKNVPNELSRHTLKNGCLQNLSNSSIL